MQYTILDESDRFTNHGFESGELCFACLADGELVERLRARGIPLAKERLDLGMERGCGHQIRRVA